MRSVMGIVLGVALGVGGAAAKRPYRTPGVVLTQASTLAALRVLDVAEDVGVERIEVFAGQVPKTFRVDVSTFSDPRLAPGTLFVAPLVRVGGDWSVAPSTRRPMILEAGSLRAAIRFVHDWRASEGQADDEALLGLVGHPAPLARRVGLAGLRGGAAGDAKPALRAQMLTLLESPGVDAEARRGLVRVLAHRGGDAGVVELAAAWTTLATDRVRMTAVGAFARSDEPAAHRALVRCAKSEMGALQARCLRVLARRARR